MIICISGKATAGKDTTAAFIELWLRTNTDKKVKILHFAADLKALAVEKFPEFADDIAKKTPLGRRLLQFLGGFYREYVHEDYWVNTLKEKLPQDPNVVILIPDTRYENEIKFSRELGGTHVHVNNSHVGLLKDNSEGRLTEYKVNYYVDNEFTLTELEHNVNILCEKLFKE